MPPPTNLLVSGPLVGERICDSGEAILSQNAPSPSCRPAEGEGGLAARSGFASGTCPLLTVLFCLSRRHFRNETGFQ